MQTQGVFQRSHIKKQLKQFVVAQLTVLRDYTEQFVSELNTVGLEQESYENYKDVVLTLKRRG